MKMLWRLSREAVRYKTLYVIAILATLGLSCRPGEGPCLLVPSRWVGVLRIHL